MTTVEVKNNFLSDDDFLAVKNLILNLDFPWRIRPNMTASDTNIYFSHSFFHQNIVSSDFYVPCIVPILQKMECVAPIEIRANMFLSKLFTESGWHTDKTFDCKTAILYLNSCNGGTELKIGDEIKFVKAEENQLLIFPSNTEHRVKSSTDADSRFIINFNYF
jgi:hypothetical protein